MNDKTLILFPSAGRRSRIDGAMAGNIPKEFFYGYLSLLEKGFPIELADSRKDPAGWLNRALLLLERGRNNFLNLGFTRQRVAANAEDLKGSGTAISFTDAFSLSLGLYGRHYSPKTFLVGGFHGLTDIQSESNTPFPAVTEKLIRRALVGLDHVFFFGDQDRLEAIQRYGLDERKATLFRFGVDTEFWSPDHSSAIEDCVFSVGSDPKRDYATLVSAPLKNPLKILTRLKLPDLTPYPHITLMQGSYHNAITTDQELRNIYQRSSIVAVPLRDVNQPSGYSVTLQAMACGKPVVLSNIRGLWDRNRFISGENCILVPPGDSLALANAINGLRGDPELRKRIGTSARETAVRYFSLDRMNEDLEKLVSLNTVKREDELQ